MKKFLTKVKFILNENEEDRRERKKTSSCNRFHNHIYRNTTGYHAVSISLNGWTVKDGVIAVP